MIPQEEIVELASFWTAQPHALSFYFGPRTPAELSHREEPIAVKEQVQQLFGSLHAASRAVQPDLDRILATVERMRGDHSQAKVIFACAREGLWREYDLPGNFPVQLSAGHSFTLLPLLAAGARDERICIALTDRNRSRLLLMQSGLIREHSSALDEEKEKIRTTGTSGSSHVERQVGEQVREHYQFLADHLLHFHEHGDFAALLVGCRDEMWPAVRAELHPDLERILIGHFSADPGLDTPEEIRARIAPLLEARVGEEHSRLFEQLSGEAARGGLGVMGIADVARSLDQGEVRTLVIPARQQSTASAGICTSCGHLGLNSVQSSCDLCGQPVHIYPQAMEALLRRALAEGAAIEVLDRELPQAEVGALLRFRVNTSTAQALAS
jgi:hypothetical protein